MKKVVIPVIIIIFGVCAFFGFKAASKIINTRQSTDEQTIPKDSNPIVSQKNTVFVHVNDLTLESPDLISIWVGFINESSPPQLMFLPIFPTYNIDLHEKVMKSFSLDKAKKVNPQFIRQLQSSFDFNITGYILSDDTGAGYSNQWMTGSESPVTSISPTTDAEKHLLLLSEQTSWKQFCQLVTAGTANSYFSIINWSLLIPDHFSTNLNFESITLLTDQIVHATSPVQCEVLSTE